MEVKLCEKCGAENKIDNEVCSSCYASLVGAKVVQSTKEPVVVSQVQPRAPRPSQPQAPAATTPQNQVYGPPPGASAVGPPPQGMFTERRPPVKQRSGGGALAFIIILILVAGGAAAGWWFYLRPPSPEQVMRTFITASVDMDAEKAKSCLTKDSLNVPGVAESFTQIGNAGDKPDPKSVQFEIKETTYEGAEKSTAVVNVNFKLPEKVSTKVDSLDIPFVLLQEEGRWKIDARQSQQRMIQSLMQQMRQRGFGGPPGPGGPGMMGPPSPPRP